MHAEHRWIAIIAAVACAVTVTTQALYTKTADALDAAIAESDTAALFASSHPEIKEALAWGRKVAAAVLADREKDGSELGVFFTPVPMTKEPYRHRDDPPDAIDPENIKGNYAKHWGQVRGFGFDDLVENAFVDLPTPVPPFTKLDYAQDFEEVQREGVFREEDTPNDKKLETGIFWAYDGAYRIGLPNRLYNDAIDAAMCAADAKLSEPPAAFTRLRVYVAANVAMADAGIAAWHEKYRHYFWRPTIGIRNDPDLATDVR